MLPKWYKIVDSNAHKPNCAQANLWSAENNASSLLAHLWIPCYHLWMAIPLLLFCKSHLCHLECFVKHPIHQAPGVHCPSSCAALPSGLRLLKMWRLLQSSSFFFLELDGLSQTKHCPTKMDLCPRWTAFITSVWFLPHWEGDVLPKLCLSSSFFFVTGS